PEPFPASSSSQHSAANLRRPRSFPTRRSSDLENYGGEEFLAGFPQNILDIPVVGGEQIGMAYSLSVPVVYYNADLMREAGLDPDNPPQTIDEWRAAGQIIQDERRIHAIVWGYEQDNSTTQ